MFLRNLLHHSTSIGLCYKKHCNCDAVIHPVTGYQKRIALQISLVHLNPKKKHAVSWKHHQFFQSSFGHILAWWNNEPPTSPLLQGRKLGVPALTYLLFTFLSFVTTKVCLLCWKVLTNVSAINLFHLINPFHFHQLSLLH